MSARDSRRERRRVSGCPEARRPRRTHRARRWAIRTHRTRVAKLGGLPNMRRPLRTTFAATHTAAWTPARPAAIDAITCQVGGDSVEVMRSTITKELTGGWKLQTVAKTPLGSRVMGIQRLCATRSGPRARGSRGGRTEEGRTGKKRNSRRREFPGRREGGTVGRLRSSMICGGADPMLRPVLRVAVTLRESTNPCPSCVRMDAGSAASPWPRACPPWRPLSSVASFPWRECAPERE